MPNLQRYSADYDGDDGLSPDPNGEYVKFSDLPAPMMKPEDVELVVAGLQKGQSADYDNDDNARIALIQTRAKQMSEEGLYKLSIRAAYLESLVYKENFKI